MRQRTYWRQTLDSNGGGQAVKVKVIHKEVELQIKSLTEIRSQGEKYFQKIKFSTIGK
jgi:hypothetical protein